MELTLSLRFANLQDDQKGPTPPALYTLELAATTLQFATGKGLTRALIRYNGLREML